MRAHENRDEPLRERVDGTACSLCQETDTPARLDIVEVVLPRDPHVQSRIQAGTQSAKEGALEAEVKGQ